MTKLYPLLALALVANSAIAQTVQARFGQHLVTSAMSANPGLQKMGIHVIPPGDKDEIIVACSVPSKIGKKSSPADLEEERSGKSFVKTVAERSFYDLALPLSDAQGRPIGAIVMEIRFAGASGPGASSQDDAVHKAEAIRDSMQRQVPSLDALFKDVPSGTPLALLSTTKLPEIAGAFDHFAIDRAKNRLYLAAEVHHSIEVFNLKTGEHLQSVPGVTTPHTIAFVPETNRLLVADGGDGSCRVFDVSDMHEEKRISLAAGPDAGFYDAEKRLFYVSNGGRAAKEDFSFISIISADSESEIGRIRIESANLESMALDRVANLLYVNLRDKNQIGVVDLAKKSLRQTWSIPNLNLNTPLALDTANHRLFVAGRKPGKLFVLETAEGKVIASLDCVETADDMTFDPKSGRLYITGAGGISVVHQDTPDRYSVIAQFDTNSGKTSIYDGALRQFYIAHAKTDFDGAALQVYAVK
jgi:DNA-binding beta-propeller fold protein YncE